ncbi:hypothetical protein [Rhizobium herbae]|uniref:Holin n=1 Tax=Rhizobium herbae TaxID=508661 RepID=A0ABS4EW25_9HYPH|nr:hypothetical protein [Rhizobium herbae]MBP1862160.1 hypothetical protein [Rhizobium herbae]
MTGPETVFGVKIATMISASIAAVISVAIEWRSHDRVTAIGSIVAGVFVAAVATEATLEFLGVANSGTWSHAVAGLYGITGRNLIIWARRASNDPPEFIRTILGIKKDSDK